MNKIKKENENVTSKENKHLTPRSIYKNGVETFLPNRPKERITLKEINQLNREFWSEQGEGGKVAAEYIKVKQSPENTERRVRLEQFEKDEGHRPISHQKAPYAHIKAEEEVAARMQSVRGSKPRPGRSDPIREEVIQIMRIARRERPRLKDFLRASTKRYDPPWFVFMEDKNLYEVSMDHAVKGRIEVIKKEVAESTLEAWWTKAGSKL